MRIVVGEKDRTRASGSPCDGIQASAATLASLRSDDEERLAAHAHAAGCDACTDALTEGAMVIAWLDAVLADPADGASPDEMHVAHDGAPA